MSGGGGDPRLALEARLPDWLKRALVPVLGLLVLALLLAFEGADTAPFLYMGF
jgi:hypothetical protein